LLRLAVENLCCGTAWCHRMSRNSFLGGKGRLVSAIGFQCGSCSLQRAGSWQKQLFCTKTEDQIFLKIGNLSLSLAGCSQAGDHYFVVFGHKREHIFENKMGPSSLFWTEALLSQCSRFFTFFSRIRKTDMW